MKAALASLLLAYTLAHATPLSSAPAPADNVLIIETPEAKTEVTVIPEERFLEDGTLIRAAILTTTYVTPITAGQQKPVKSTIRTTLYNCKHQTMVIMMMYLLGTNGQVLSATEVMQEVVARPNSDAQKEFTFVCSKPPKLNPAKMI